MKTRNLFIFICTVFTFFVKAQDNDCLSFKSSDKQLESTFMWAKQMALSFAHDGSDPVGYWYEAALPNREAFCMRDISHQCVGGEILGLSKHNYNMMFRFAENIAESRDWCSYWEINRHNKPAPVDYVDDEQFWYTLPASLDVLQACLKLYNWTGNKQYLYNPVFENFYEKTLNQYINHWQLNPDELLIRPTYMNTELPMRKDRKFNGCKGIPSYVETEGGFSLAGDLVASLYSAFNAYSRMLVLKDQLIEAEHYKVMAERYKSVLNDKFWDKEKNHFNFFWSCVEGDFLDTEMQGETYIVWFDAASSPERAQITLDRILKMECNVENQSHYPTLLYRYRMPDEAYKYMTSLQNSDRSDYPEVSFGVIEGLIGGLVGVQPDASNGILMTLPQLSEKTQWVEVSKLPVLGTDVDIKHEGQSKSILTNKGNTHIKWRASFYGEYKEIKVNNKKVPAKYNTDIMGNVYSFVDVEVGSEKTVIVNI